MAFRLLTALLALGVMLGVPQPAIAAATSATVSVGAGVLYARTGPGTDHQVAAELTPGTRLRVRCQVAGERIDGQERTTAVWDRLTDGRYVSDAYVRWRPRRPAVRWCGGDARVRTTSGRLNLRRTAATEQPPAGSLASDARVVPQCQLAGESIAGAVRTTSLWLRVDGGRYLSDAFVAWHPRRPALTWCDQPADPPPATRGGFIRWAVELARESRRAYGVPVSVTIAQAIHESGWGRSGLSVQGNAYFGVKCFGTPGPIAVGCRPYATHECADDRCFAATGTFRVYRTAAESFRDHGRFLRVNPRYRRAFARTGDPDRFVREIHKAGYATGPRYADGVIDLMRQFDLYRYDR